LAPKRRLYRARSLGIGPFLDVTGNERFGEPSINKVTMIGTVAMMQHLKKLQFLRQRALHFLFILG
jgi:hypothetical protein